MKPLDGIKQVTLMEHFMRYQIINKGDVTEAGRKADHLSVEDLRGNFQWSVLHREKQEGYFARIRGYSRKGRWI